MIRVWGIDVRLVLMSEKIFIYYAYYQFDDNRKAVLALNKVKII